MKIRLYILLLSILPFVSACSNEENFENYRQLDVAALNKKIHAADRLHSGNANDPMKIAIHLFGAGDAAKTQELTLKSLNKGESTREVKITIINEGFMDDSVDGEKYVVFMERGNDNRWKISRCYSAWKCAAGRGHRSYSKEPCS